MKEYQLIATTNFGLEAVTKREIQDMGFIVDKTEDGRVEVSGDAKDMAKLNLRLRTAERVLIKIGEFEARTFEELFHNTYDLDWANILPEDGNFIVQGRSVKSQLFSISDCQRIVEKAIIKKLQSKYHREWFEKSGSRYKIEVSLLKDIATITLDTSGEGLHKRGYREVNYKAPISETIAASLVLLSYWNSERMLCDPFCGSGTIPIEAAMIGKEIAPGLMRKFDMEHFAFLDSSLFKEEKKRCYEEINYDKKLDIFASDISYQAIQIAKSNAEILGLEEDIHFFHKDIADLELPDEYGVLITNPPYGERIGAGEVSALNREIGELYRSVPTWSFYVITASESFEKDFGKKASRNRKLYNGRLKTYYYQYYGPKPRSL